MRYADTETLRALNDRAIVLDLNMWLMVKFFDEVDWDAYHLLARAAEIARGLNRDDVPTGQAGRQWWRSTVRAVLLRSSQGGSARTEGAQR